MLRLLSKRFDRWRQLSWRERRLLVRATVMVAAVRVALWTGSAQSARTLTSSLAGAGGDHVAVSELVWAVTAAARVIPGATCLTQAFALEGLMKRSGHQCQVEIGVAKTAPGAAASSSFRAHAWVLYRGEVVLGGDEAPGYSPMLAWK